MESFSPSLIKQLYSLLTDKYEKIFIKSIKPFNEKRIFSDDFEGFILETLENNFKPNSEKEDIQEVSNTIVRNKQRMKKNWFNAFQKEIKEPQNIKEANKSILKEVEVFEKMKDKAFRKSFGVSTTEELINIRTAEVVKWQKDKSSNLIDYYYFEYKKPYQKLSAFNCDICMEILYIIETHYNGTLDGFTKQRATELIENPIFGINKILLSMDTIIDENSNSPMLFNDYQVSEDYILRTIVREPQKVKVNDCYMLDERDSEIIDMVFAKIKPNFYRDKTIEVDIGDIVKRVYPSQNSHSYKDAEDRIMKISLFQIQGLIKEKDAVKDTKFNINFFDHAIIETDPQSNKRIAKIVFGEILHNRYINGKTVRVASYHYKQVKKPLSKILFFTFQKERLERSVSNGSNIHREEYNYLFFRHKVRFKSRNRTENMKLIEESLEEFVNEKFLIKEYQKLSDSFLIEFYPLSEEEKQDFGISVKSNMMIANYNV